MAFDNKMWIITLFFVGYCYASVQEETGGREAAVNYLREGAMNLNRPCDNFYGAVCSRYKDTFSDIIHKFHLMTTETQTMSDLIQNMSMLLNEIVDGNHGALMPFEIYLATDYRTCVQQRRQSITQTSEVNMQTRTLSLQSGQFQNKRSFREPDYVAHYYLKNWTAEQECAYNMIVSREASSAHVYISRFLGWHVGDRIREAAEEVRTYTEKALISTILNFEWIDWPSKRRMVQLINETSTLCAYDDWLKNVTIVTDCVYNNGPNVNCREEILYVHPYYEQTSDVLFVPLGTLLPPLFNPDYPATFKFGILGQKIAESYVRILLRAQVRGESTNLWGKVNPISKLFSIFMCEDDGNCLTNTFHKDEQNYAAVMGLKIALAAYRLYALDNGVESRMQKYSGVTDEQMLFVAYARSQCATFTADARRAYGKQGLLSEFYSDKMPPPVRLLAAAMSLSEFSDVFECQDFHRMSTVHGIDL